MSWELGEVGVSEEEEEEEESTQHVVSVFVYISETVITECHTCEWKVLETKTNKNAPITRLLLPPLLLLISRGGTNVVTTDNADCFFFFIIPVRL